MKESKVKNIVYVEWNDSYDSDSKWINLDETTNRLATVYTVGIVLEDTKKHLLLTPHYCNGKMSRHIAIPKGCIVKMKVLAKLNPQD
jgi:hypothetical protein